MNFEVASKILQEITQTTTNPFGRVTFRCLDLFEHLFSLLALKKTIGEFLSAIRSNHRRCSIGKHLCWSLFFNKATDLRPATSLKKKLQRRCFPVNIAKFLRAILKNSGRLLLSRICWLTETHAATTLWLELVCLKHKLQFSLGSANFLFASCLFESCEW